MKKLLIAAALASATAAGGALAQDSEVGHMLYNDFCVACHGEMGKGGGELAGLMTIEVPDLTGLSARNDGEFPMLKVIHIIDGRTGMRAHGGPMPVFGKIFTAQAYETGPYGPVLETRGRVLALAMYLESIQGK